MSAEKSEGRASYGKRRRSYDIPAQGFPNGEKHATIFILLLNRDVQQWRSADAFFDPLSFSAFLRTDLSEI